jgi:quinol monooxygenase YgiN
VGSVIIRIFDTAMDPGDVEQAKELFRTEVKPAFAQFDGCHGIEMTIGIEEHSRDLVDVASISRWDSVEAIQEAIHTEAYATAMENIKRLFLQAPLIRHFEAVD